MPDFHVRLCTILHIFTQFTCKGGHRQQAGHRLRAVWSDAGMKATFALPMNSSVDIVIFSKVIFPFKKRMLVNFHAFAVFTNKTRWL